MADGNAGDRSGAAVAADARRVARWRRGFARALRATVDKYPLTWLGTLLAAAGWLALRELGRKRQDIVLYVAGAGALVVVGLVSVGVAITAITLLVRTRPQRRADQRVEAGQPIRTGFSLPSLGFLPLVSLRWEWIAPSSVQVESLPERGRLVEEVIFGQRGEHLVTVRRVIVEDVLGLSRIAFSLTESSPRTVRPALGRPLVTPLLEAFAAGDHVSHPHGPPDGDLVDMRRYGPGDPMKRILWKVYARTRNLMVRLPERAISPTRRVLAFLVAGEGDEAASGVARLAVESGALGDEWRFSADLADGETADANDSPAALSLIIKSRAAHDRGGQGLLPFLERSDSAGGGRCVVFAPARPGPWLARVEEAARARGGSIEVVLGIDGLHGAAPSRFRRLFVLPDDDGLDLAGARGDGDEIQAITRRLAACGATVTVVDRPSGKALGRSARRRRRA